MVRIMPIQVEEKKEVSQFVIDNMTRLFPKHASIQMPPYDLVNMENVYMNPQDAVFYTAREVDGTLAATIAVRRYDGRIKVLPTHFGGSAMAEILKCYVDKTKRRMGIGSLLTDEILQFCRSVGYQKVYLHTHKFLPDAVQFWQSQGFEEILDEKDILETVHMVKNI